MKRMLIFAMAAVVMFAGVASSAVAQDKKLVLGFSIGNTVEPFYKVLEDGVRKCAADLGVEVVVASADGGAAKAMGKPGEPVFGAWPWHARRPRRAGCSRWLCGRVRHAQSSSMGSVA